MELFEYILVYLLIGTLFSMIMHRHFNNHPESEVRVRLFEVILMITVWPYFLYQFLVGLFGGGNGPTLSGGH